MKGPVWLVDDMECALEIMKLFLEKNGYTTEVYSCPLKALHDLEQGQKPQLIITDYCMPEMSGTDFLDTAHSIFPDLPCIIITGDPSPIALKYRSIPIVEKGHIDFIKQLLEQVSIVLSSKFSEQLHSRKKSKTTSSSGLLKRRNYNKKQSDTYKMHI